MTFKEKVNGLLVAALDERPSVFLIDFDVTNNNKIIVTLDSDSGITLQDCIDVSRAIEHNLDREEKDFSIEVASVGLSKPLKMVRQYRKNIGRKLIVKTATEKIEAYLVDATDDSIVIEWLARESKQIGKGKENVQKRMELSYSEIIEAIVTVTF